MELEYFGANCFRIKTKQGSAIIDDNLDKLGGKNPTKDADVVFYTSRQLVSEKAIEKARLIIDSAGEFEVGDLSAKSIQTRGHMDEEGVESAFVHQFLYEGTTLTVLGHVHPDLSDDLLEMIGGTDVLVVPVGGNGYTLDAVGATSVIKKIEPHVIIPSQYDASGLNFEIPAAPLGDFIKTAALHATEPKDNYAVNKPDAELAGQTHIVVLNIKKA